MILLKIKYDECNFENRNTDVIQWVTGMSSESMPQLQPTQYVEVVVNIIAFTERNCRNLYDFFDMDMSGKMDS